MIGSVYDFLTLPRQVREANIRRAILEGINVNVNVNGERSWRNVSDGEARIVREKEPVERIILRLAKRNNGLITVSELAMAADISVDEAKKDLEAMVSKGYAELRVRQSGSLVYTIPDLMNDNDPLVD